MKTEKTDKKESKGIEMKIKKKLVGEVFMPTNTRARGSPNQYRKVRNKLEKRI